MKPCYADERATIYRGDALTILAGLPDGCADAVIADPPYNSGGVTPSERRRQTVREKYTTGRRGDLVHELESFDGDHRDQRGYLAWLTLVLTEGQRVTVPGGSVVVATDWRQLPTTSDAVQAAGWIWAGIVTWAKPRHRSRPRRGGFWNQAEFFVWGRHGALRTDHDACLSGVIEAAAPPADQREHPTQKPTGLMRELVRVAPPGGLVADPFGGAGTTGVAAMLEGRRYLGVERSKHYAAVAVRRIREAQGQAVPSGDQAALPLGADTGGDA